MAPPRLDCQALLKTGYGEQEQFITVLELLPDDSAAVVKVGVVYQAKKARKKK